MSQDGPEPSEDDLRTKIIYPWLQSRGLQPADVDVEFAFSVRIGKKLVKVARTDVLVKKRDDALFVIECKREDHELTKDDQQQAISYARLVQPTMAPYAILTNGVKTVILDTYSGGAVEADAMTSGGILSSPAALDEILRLRNLAAKHLLSLSSHTLARFLQAHISDHISAHSAGQKRPPFSAATHVPRLDVRRKILDFCSEARGRILPIVGASTIGKTSEIFAFIEEFTRDKSAGVLPLYIPINISGPDFLSHLAEDFGWAFGQHMNATQLVCDIDAIAKAQCFSCVTYVLDGADLEPYSLDNLRGEIEKFVRRTEGLACRHKLLIVAQESTWSRLIAGRGIDLSGHLDLASNGPDRPSEVHVNPLSEAEFRAHVRALEVFYGRKMPRLFGMPRLPAITHMMAQQSGEAGDKPGTVLDVLGKYFKWQLSKVTDRGAVLNTLIDLSTQMLDGAENSGKPRVLTGLDGCVSAGFLVQKADAHAREVFAFSDDWIRFYIVGVHIWRMDEAAPAFIAEIANRAESNLEYSRALEWYALTIGDDEKWRLAAERRPLMYLRCYQQIAQHIKAFSIGGAACIWLAPHRGRYAFPWLAIIGEGPCRVHWGADPEVQEEKGAPRSSMMTTNLSIFGRKTVPDVLADDAIKALREIRKWLEDPRKKPERELWPSQLVVLERLRGRLRHRSYNLAPIAHTLESLGGSMEGVELLQEIFQSALDLVHSIAESEFSAICDSMPKRIRIETEVASHFRERTVMYDIDSEIRGVELVLGPAGKISSWPMDLEFRREQKVRVTRFGWCLHKMLNMPPHFASMGRAVDWRALKERNHLRGVNAVGNVAARWLASGIERAISANNDTPELKAQMLEWCEGVS